MHKEKKLSLIKELREKYRKRKKRLWLSVIKNIDKARRKGIEVNIEKIDKLAKRYKDKVFLIPGKVLGDGELTKKIRVVALEFSKNAEQIINKNGEAITLSNFIKSNVDEKDIMLIK